MNLWHVLHQFWDYIGGNVVATPFCGALAGVGATIFRKQIGRWMTARWNKHGAPVVQAVTAHLAAKQDDHHQRLAALLDRQHQEHMDRLDVHAEALKAHVTETVAAATPPPGDGQQVKVDFAGLDPQAIADWVKSAARPSAAPSATQTAPAEPPSAPPAAAAVKPPAAKAKTPRAKDVL